MTYLRQERLVGSKLIYIIKLKTGALDLNIPNYEANCRVISAVDAAAKAERGAGESQFIMNCVGCRDGSKVRSAREHYTEAVQCAGRGGERGATGVSFSSWPDLQRRRETTSSSRHRQSL